ncbi:unnamed protein product [Phytophthora fragariaefolia]|uniref:Unnamed protein product n=1 Tax=Phytophthora fragariaefolia TaxID=1490495 RepID=A0A9W7CWU0_9STRA|nr:unnamed protein product [Phytophthora fragariaefolia]
MGGEEASAASAAHGAASSAQFSSNAARYAERAEAGGLVRALQEELAGKLRELQVHEGNYVTLKKELARWKKKFEYVFRENELLALETGKLDASHKQVAFLQQELKFKEEEGAALRGLVAALEAANKKQRAKQLEAARARDSLREADAAAERQSSENADAALARERAARADERARADAERAALKAENALLLKDVDRKDDELARADEQVAAHRARIDALERALADEQAAGMARLREKQERVLELETQLQQMELRRRSSVAAALALAEREGRDTVGFGPTHRLEAGGISEAGEAGDADDEEPDTPPGTPPPMAAGGLLPPEDPTADQTIRDWSEDRKVRAARSFEDALDLDRLEELIRKLPFEHQEGASRVLMGALDPDSHDEPVDESQIVLRHLSAERQAELRDFLIPLLKAHPALRVAYSTMERRTLVTDVRIQIERRRDSVLGGFVPGEKRFGKDHVFLGPSPEDVGKLVPHMPRAISTGSKAIYVSKPKNADLVPVAAASPLERPSEHTDDMDTTSESADVPDVTISKRKWGGLNAAKFIGTMAAGAKQRVAATFKNAKYTHEGTSCQFCKMTPIVGERYSCSTCVGFDLCENCYSLGGHGLENSDELFYRVQELALARCSRLAEEVDLLELLRFEICRSNLRKFSFCLNWLADIVNGKSSKDLQARALEIPSIRRDVRKVFVPLLMRVCSDREDIEVKTEWELEDDNQAPVRSVGGGVSEGDGRFLETLRIWVADQYRTTSPFVERSLLKYREGEEGEEDEDGSDNDTHSDDRQSHENDEPGEPGGEVRRGVEGTSSQPGFVERNRVNSDAF